MQIQSARWEYHDGFPTLALTFEGDRRARITVDACEPARLRRDIVRLLPTRDDPDWIHDLPPVTVPDECGLRRQLPAGCLQDPGVARLAREFCAAVRVGVFTPWPLEWDRKTLD